MVVDWDENFIGYRCQPSSSIELIFYNFQNYTASLQQPIDSCLFRYYKYEQKLSSLFWKIEFKDIIMEDIDSTEADIKIKVRCFCCNIYFIFDARLM